MATTKELIELSKQLKNFHPTVGELAIEKLTRHILYLSLFQAAFLNDEYLRGEACNFVSEVFHLYKTKQIEHHLLIADCIDKEIKRRETGRKPRDKELQLPKFLVENTAHLDILVKCLWFLINGEDSSNPILDENTKRAEQVAAEKAPEIYKAYLEDMFRLNYSK